MNKLLKNQTKTEEIDNFKIKYKKLLISKNIKITLKNQNELLVTMPILCPFKTAKEFLLKNFDKIKSFKITKKVYDKNFKTKFDSLKIFEGDSFNTTLKKNIVYFTYPKQFDFSSELVQKNFEEAYLKALKQEAKNYLPQRLKFLAEKFNFSFGKISLRNQKTRFGSCSFKNDISLNINLMKYDFDIIDYVLIHELCHTRVKNHSKKFWDEVEKYCSNYKELRHRLKNS